jgi:general secretion pathway protein A
MSHHCIYFGFKTPPFSSEINTKDLLKLPSMTAVKERFDYVTQGGVFILTGEVGSGKSTALRWAQSHFHPSQYLIINITATGGSLIEFYRQLCWGLNVEAKTGNRTALMQLFKTTIRDIASAKKQKILVVVDESHLLRIEVFSELHTATQFDHDSKNLFSITLAGQASLLDKLTYRTSAALASRVITRTHLSNLNQEQVTLYIEHHLAVAGMKKQLFTPPAITAIYQGSAGILRKINQLSRGGLIAAAAEKTNEVTPEHIRIASTELM